jgi:alpha-1,6-mannosyltransferase
MTTRRSRAVSGTDTFVWEGSAVPNDLTGGLTAPRVVGCAGSALVAVGGLGAGALPLSAGAAHARIGLVGVYSGLALLLMGWWWYGRTGGTTRQAYVTLALWTAPLMVAPPMFSRDVYSYLAQGLMIDSGLDVYQHGPAVLGGLVADQVPAIWQYTPSPYGPMFLVVAKGISGVVDTHLLAGVLAMRLVALGGLALLAWSLPIAARATGINPASALWLATLNPLVLIHLIGGAHNDALMVGLLAAGLAAALRDRPVTASVLVAAAGLVKAPAALGLVAVATIWAARLPGRWPLLRAAAAVGGTAAATTAVLTRVAGTGYGWVGALSTPISAQNWSITGVLGRWTADTFAHDDVGAALAVSLWRYAGILATLIVAALVWTYRGRLGPVYGLGIVLVALVVFGPALRPWYLIWGLIPLAVAAGHPRVRLALTVACAVLLPVVLPDGFSASLPDVLLAVLGGLLGLGAYLGVRLALARVEVGVAR